MATVTSGSEDEEGAQKDTEASLEPEDDAPIEELHELEAEAVISPEPVEAVPEIPVEADVEADVEAEGVVDEVVEEHPQVDSISESGNVLSGNETNLERDAGLDSDVADIQPIPTGSDKTAVDDLEELSSDAADRMDEVKARPAPDDDLVAMVNMLESKPTTTFRPEIAAGIPQEDVQEIPDED